MDIRFLIAQINGKPPEGFVRPAVLETGLPECRILKRCRNKVAIKRDGTPARAWERCLARRAASRRRRKALSAEGGCRRCAYRPRLKGDFLCARCREDRDIERAQKRQDTVDAAAVDEFAAKPDKAHNPSNLDCGISPWNREKSRPEPSAGYWSPLPDPDPAEQGWRWSLMNGRLHHRY